MQISNQYNIKTSSNQYINKLSFKRKLNLPLYGDAGKLLKELKENTVIGQKESENTVLGLAILGLSSIIGANADNIDVEGIRTIVSEKLRDTRKNVYLDKVKNEQEKQVEEEKSLLQEMANCGMTLEQIGIKLGCTKSSVSKMMKKYNIKTDFSRKYNTGLTKIRDNSPLLQKALNEKKYRKQRLDALVNYSDFQEKYKRMLINAQKHPKNVYYNRLVQVFEHMMYKITKPSEVNYHKEFLEAINNKYIDDLENICVNYESNKNAHGSFWKFMSLFQDEKISSEELREWTQYPEFNSNDFLALRPYSPEQKQDFAHLKRNKEFETFYIWKPVGKNGTLDGRNAFKIVFQKDKKISDCFKTICKIHEIAYGTPIGLGREKYGNDFTWINVNDELYDSIKHDSQLDSTYNLLKFVGAENLKKYNYTSKEVRDLDFNSTEYKTLLGDIRNAIHNIDYEGKDAEKINAIVKAMNRKDLFEDIMITPHSILRFISRIVLKDNDNNTSDLETMTQNKMKIFREEIDAELKNKPVIWSYKEKIRNAYAPKFQIKNSEIGEFMTLTLDKNGKIHTIYEDKFAITNARQKDESLNQ